MAQRQVVVYRAKPRETRIQNQIIWDDNLSPMARFVLIAMLSLPDSWDFSIRGMAVMLHISKDTMSKYIRELESAGYLRRTQSHSQAGQFASAVYILTDTPGEYGDPEQSPCPKNSDTGDENESPCPNLSAPVLSAPEKSPQKKRTKEKKRTEQYPPISPVGVLAAIDAYIGDDPEYRDAFCGFLENRAALKNPVKTVRAINTIINRLRRVNHRETEIAMLDNATAHNWLTVYPLKPDELPTRNAPDFDEEGLDGI